ncbi:MAG: sugar ABC transporter permease, partial [Clostridia bacterium]|nr:sugar ABC transporter permease [Clostridia bacterium]
MANTPVTMPAVRRDRTRIREAGVGVAFILPSMLGCFIFVVIPFGDAIRRSFTHGLQGAFAGLENYVGIFGNASFQQASVNTLRFIALCVPLLVICSLGLAMLLSKPLTGQGALRAAFLLPMAIPVASVAMLWQVLFHGNGLINSLLSVFSLSPVDWMRTDYALLCLVVSYLWKNTGYTMVLFLAGLGGISPALYEAAAVDGAGPWRRFSSITWPCLRPTLFTVTVLSLLNTFKAYREAWLVAGNYPQGSIYLLQHTLNN